MIEFKSMNAKIWSRLGSCGAFGQGALALPEINDNTVILTADLTFFSGLNRFATSFPQRLYNFGIAEQNMLGAAGGFAKEGLLPFVTSYSAFADTRCADQVKLVMGYMNLNVKLVGLVSGYAAGILGPTHMCLEDIAFMRTMPNVLILSPADCTAVVKSVLLAAQHEGPVYLRLTGPMNAPIVYTEEPPMEIGKAITLREGEDIALVATGSMVHSALQVAQLLQSDGISAKVLDMHTLAPMDEACIKACCSTKLLVTIEEHMQHGGLGGAVAEILAPLQQRVPHLIVGVPRYYHHAASYQHLIEQSALSPQQIYTKTLEKYKEISNV